MKLGLNKTTLACAMTFLFSLPFSLQANNYLIDTKGAHASINFKVSHLGYSFIKGRFNRFSGSFTFDEKDIQHAQIKVVVDTQSIDTNHAERDKHIRSDDFIDASKYKQASFQSTKIVPLSKDHIEVHGELSLHGITKPIQIAAQFIGSGKDPWGGERAGFMGHTRLELADFNIPIMGTSSYVDLELHIEGIKQK